MKINWCPSIHSCKAGFPDIPDRRFPLIWICGRNHAHQRPMGPSFEDFKYVIWEEEDRRFVIVFHLDLNQGRGRFSMVFHELLINMAVLNSCSNTILLLVLKIHSLQRNTVCTENVASVTQGTPQKEEVSVVKLSVSVRFYFLCTWIPLILALSSIENPYVYFAIYVNYKRFGDNNYIF